MASFITLSLLLMGSAMIAAQSSTGPFPAVVTVSGGSQVVNVGLDSTGAAALSFNPSSVVAAAGDKLVFNFYAPEHSVAQSTFDAPCTPDGSSAIYSGTIVSSGGVSATTFTVTVSDTTPMWFYCAYDSHCKSGMVFAVNPTSDNTFAAFQSAAKAASADSAPDTVQGGTLSNGSNTSGSMTSASASPTSSAPATSSTAAASGGGSSNEASSYGNTGAVVMVGLAVAGAAAFMA